MRSFAPLGVLGIIFAASSADAATLTGTVTGPDGAPFRAAFVQARNAGLKMTVSVLSDNQGNYIVENLPAGDYRLSIRAVGFKADAKSGVKLTADQNATQDFALQKGMVRWTDISIYQGLQLLPDARGKKNWPRIAWAATASNRRWRQPCATRTAGAAASISCAKP